MKSYEYSERAKKNLRCFLTDVATWFNKSIAHSKHVIGTKWLTISYSYTHMKKNIWFGNDEWNAIISDGQPQGRGL